MKSFAIFVVLVGCAIFAESADPLALCKQGGCCDIVNGIFKVAGTVCVSSKHPCLESSSFCTGFSEKCDRKFRPDGTKCYASGSCKQGVCLDKDGMPLESPAKSADIAGNMASLKPQSTPKPQPTPAITPAATATPANPATPNATPATPATPAKPAQPAPVEEDQNTVIVHKFHDPIAETLEHIPELAARRARKQAIADRKVQVFRKLTHFVVRKHKENLENNEIFERNDKRLLQEEQHDLKNLHRHLHLHHQQHHGLDTNLNANLSQALQDSMSNLKSSLSSGDGSSTDYSLYIMIGTLGFVAVMLIVFIVGSAVKNSKNKKKTEKDYY
jgi:hypothetical protein